MLYCRLNRWDYYTFKKLFVNGVALTPLLFPGFHGISSSLLNLLCQRLAGVLVSNLVLIYNRYPRSDGLYWLIR